MAFINEYISQENIHEFQLDKLWDKYNRTNTSIRNHWTVDNETGTWLIPIKKLKNSETIWILHYKNTNIEIHLWIEGNHWDLTSISSNSLDNTEIIEILHQAMEVSKANKAVWWIPKEVSAKENKEIKTTIKKTSKRKITYLDVLTALIIVVVIFFIANDSNDDISSVETKKPKVTKNKVYEKIDSYESLNYFIKDGQKNGYFPKKILTGDMPTANDRLQPISIEHYKKIKWDMNAKCSNSASDIILGLNNENHSIECGGGDTVVITGKGDDWIDDAFGNDIFYTGEGDDTIDTSWGNDIFIFEKNWGHDKIDFRPNTVNTSKIKGYDGSYPWKYASFIIFGKDINRSDIYWMENTLVHKGTGDTIKLNSKKINIIFSSESNSKLIDKNFIPEKKELKKIDITQMKGQSLNTKDGIIYLTNNSFSIISFKDKTNSTLLSQTYLPGPNVTSVTIQGNIAYVTQAAGGFSEGSGGWVSIIDISSKTKPKILHTLKFGDNIFNVAVKDNYLYVADTNFSYSKNRNLFIYDISTPSKPQLTFKTKLKYYSRSLAYSNGLLFLSTFNDDIVVFDVTNPQSPVKVSQNFSFENRVQTIKADANIVVLHQDGNTLNILETNALQEIKNVCKIQTDKVHAYSSNKSSAMTIADGLIYTADLKEGVSILDIATCQFKERIYFEDIYITSVGVIDNYLFAMNRDKLIVYDLNNKYENKIDSKLSQDQLQTLLYDAAADDDADKVKKLCKAGANPNIKGHNNHTPLQISARLGNMKSLKALLDSGAEVDGNSMVVASLLEQIEAMKLLEKYGGDIGQKDNDGCSTLHYLASDGTLEMVKYLVKKGVSHKTTCRGGETPLKWAKSGKNKNVIKYLENLDRY